MIEHLHIDGVPVAFVRKPGPLCAGLTFRVGQADESLSNRGITHLIEHLALFSLGLTDYHSNGQTGSVFTQFHVQGSAADVPDFFSSVCGALASLPLERLETEKLILRTEESGRNNGPAAQLPLWRYGAQGYGLVSYPEWGLERLTGPEVSEWAQSWFTRENAALWVVGEEIPDNLRLPLPAGTRRAVPVPTSVLGPTPAYVAAGQGKVVLDTVVQRHTAATVFSVVLERELFRHLRQEGGYSYAATTSYDPRDADSAHITAFADALPEKMDAVLGGFVDVLATVRLGQFDEAVVSAAKARFREGLSHPDIDAMRVPRYSADLLVGAEHRSLDELRSELESVTAADVHAVAVEALGSALLQVPVERTAEWAGFALDPVSSGECVQGIRHAHLENPDATLVSGPAGVSLTSTAGPVTVRFDECVAQLRWPDGGRLLIGRDGFTVLVEPTLWVIGQAERDRIDTNVDPSLVIPMPVREPSEIPQPQEPSGAQASTPGWSRGAIAMLIALSVAATFAVLVSVGATLGAVAGSSSSDTWVGVSVFWIVTAGILWPLIRLIRRRRS